MAKPASSFPAPALHGKGTAVKEHILIIRQDAPVETFINLYEQDFIILLGFGNTVKLIYVYDCNKKRH